MAHWLGGLIPHWLCNSLTICLASALEMRWGGGLNLCKMLDGSSSSCREKTGKRRSPLQNAKHLVVLEQFVVLDLLSELHVLACEVSDVPLLVLVDIGHSVKLALQGVLHFRLLLWLDLRWILTHLLSRNE
jgi:hypothetical protein